MKKILPKLITVITSVLVVAYCAYNYMTIDTNNEYEALLAQAEKYKGYTAEQLKKIPKRDRPDLAGLQDFEMTMDPALGYPPVERKIKAFDLAQSILKKSSKNAKIDGVTWEERGPNNVGGRTRALMFDPNDSEVKKVWAGGIGGGLWYNNDITDPKTTWIAVDNFMANIAISTITFDPSNTQVYYMGTGLTYAGIRGAGIWKSTDAGATWDRLASTDNSDFYFTQKIQITEAGIVLAGTNSGLMRSIDGGATWTEVLEEGISDIEIAQDGDVIASIGHIQGQLGGIYLSGDNGENWNDISPTDPAQRTEIGVAPSNPNVLYAVADIGAGSADVAWFKKSNDKGATWDDIEIPMYSEQDCSVGTSHFTRGQAFFNLILGVHPLQENTVVVGGIDLHKSTNGGSSWGGISYWTGSGCDDYVHADQHALVYRPGHPNEAIFGNDGGVFYSANVGNAADPEFESRNNGYNVTTFYSAASANDVNSNVFLAGSQDNGTQFFNSPGVNSTTEATGGDGGFCFIDQDNSDIMITSTTENDYRLSTDGGKSFTSIGSNADGRFINPAEYDSDANILYAAGDVNQITRVSGIGDTPSSQQTISISVEDRQITHIKASPYTENVLFIGVRISNDEGKLYKLESANTTPVVTEITGTYTGSHGGWISSIDVGASDDHLLATFSNYGVSSVYETTDGGLNWADKNGNLPDMPVRWGLYNPNNRSEVLLATEVGVWSTGDLSLDSPVWEPTNEGLANVRTDMIKYNESDQMVTIATYGRGLYTTNVFVTATEADFSTKQTVAYVGVPVQFTNASLNPNDSWSWTFGDGSGTSEEQNPSYTYETPGVYSVSLAVDEGSSDETKTDYITVLPVKTMPYTLADGGDFESNLSDFTAQSISGGVSHWEVGVPANRLTTVSSGTNAWKTLLEDDVVDLGQDYKAGLYTPAFDLSDASKEYTLKFKKSMENEYCNAPHAMQMQYSVDGGINWFTLGNAMPEYGSMNWYNQASNLNCALPTDMFPNQMGWVATNIDGQTDNTVDNENTEYKISFLAGESNVSFRFVSAYLAGYSSTYERDGFMIDDFEITAEDPAAEFEADNRLVFSNQEVKFTYVSNGATSFQWNFGDGSPASTEMNPTHSYSAPGLYSVTLTVDGSGGQIQEMKEDYITVLPDRTVPYTLADGGDFESNQSDFAVENITGTPLELGSSTIIGKDGTASGSNAWVTGLTDNVYVDNSEAYLYTPSFDFSNLGEYVFKFKAKFEFEANWDGFIVEYSLDRGSVWAKLNDAQEENWYNQISDPQAVFGANVPIFSGSTNGEFKEFFTDVSSLSSNESVSFRFTFLTDANSVDVGLALDDFELEGPAVGPAVPDFTSDIVAGCDGHTVIFTNTSEGSISSLLWNFGAGATPATAGGLGPHEVIYSSGISTVSLTVESSENGTQVETKIDFITTGADHSPTIMHDGITGNEFNLRASDGDSFQWFYKGSIIEGATNQTYVSDEIGKYEVEVSIDGCIVKTDALVVVSGIDDLYSDSNSTKIYPIPSIGELNISLQNDYTGLIQITMYDLQGKTQGITRDFNKYNSQEDFILDVSQLRTGIYMMEVVYGNNRLMRQIVIGK